MDSTRDPQRRHVLCTRRQDDSGGHRWDARPVLGGSIVSPSLMRREERWLPAGSLSGPWLTGVVLLLVILGFALSGYLLPWDQKAYWATTVTINIARSGPFGEFVAGLLQGGDTLGSLTLLRWYAGARVPVARLARRLRARASLSHAPPRHLRRAEAGAGRSQAVLSVSRAQGHHRRRARVCAADHVRRFCSERRSTRSPTPPTRTTCRVPSGTSSASFSC